MKISTYIYNSFCVVGLLAACAVFLAGCTDELSFVDVQRDASNGNTLQFNVATREMGDMMIGIGSTRAGQSASSREADAFTAKPLTGDNPYGLGLQRMPIPYVGIHSKAVRSSASQASATRASVDDIVKKDGTNFHDSLSIWGYTDGGVELFDGNLLMRITNWRSAVSWPYETGAFDPGNTMRFYAISPAMESLNISSTEDEPSYNAAPVFKLTLPESPSEMRDVLYGESDEISIPAGPDGSITEDPKSENIGQDNKHVDLAFSHILTAIRFAQGANFPANVTVEKIRLTGIYASGIFDPNETDELTGTKGKWTIPEKDAEKYDYVLTNLSTNVSGANTYIDGQQVLFMIPHVLGENDEKPKLEVVLSVPKRFETDKDGNLKKDENGNRIPYTGAETVPHPVSCTLEGDFWKKGYTVTYRIGIGEIDEGYYLMVEAPDLEFEHSLTEITSSFNVHSYRSRFDYSNNPLGEEVTSDKVEWEVEGYFSDKNGEYTQTAPTWLKIDESDKGEFTLKEQEYQEKLNHKTILQGNSIASGTIDLSTHYPDGRELETAETANCYIVNRYGMYTFPLVYGNKETDGDEPAGIVDHRGNIISYSTIRDQIKNKYPDMEWDQSKLQAKIIWTDISGLGLTPKVTMNSYGDYYMTVDLLNGENKTDYLAPGNIVIALLYTGNGKEETLWTWHIWVTDEVYANGGNEKDIYYLNHNEDGSHIVDIENYDGVHYKILPVNLGWVPDNNVFGVYEPREVYVKIRQTESKSNETAIIHIKQHARQDLITGTSTIYQWGRPTALPMTLTCDGKNTTRKIYDGNNNDSDISSSFTLTTASDKPSGYHITNPKNMFRWDDTNDGNSVWFDRGVVTIPSYWTASDKSVYDPCPPGYRVPTTDVFSGLSRTGAGNLYGSQLNTYPDVSYTDADGNSKTASNLSRNTGGYFYTSKYISEQYMEENRYAPLVYFPVTGEWQGDVADGAQLNGEDLKTNNTHGIYWCADDAPSDPNNASTLWIHPEWENEVSTTKPPIQFGQIVKYSSAQAIRPVAVP